MSRTQSHSQKYSTIDLSSSKTEDGQIVTNKGRLVITDSFKKKVDMLHDIVGNIEWCGYLIYRHISGTMDDPSSVLIEALDIFPMNIGSHSYTEAEASSSTADLMDRLMEYGRDETCQTGLIHTHHTMSTFFSGTDDQELHDSVACYKGGYFLSLIVNKTLDWKAKAVYLGEVETPTLYDAVIPNAVENMPSVVKISTPAVKHTYMFSMELNVEVPNVGEDTIVCPFAVGQKISVNGIDEFTDEPTTVEYIVQYERNGTMVLRPAEEPAEDIELAGIRERILIIKEESKTKHNKSYGGYNNGYNNGYPNAYGSNNGVYSGDNRSVRRFDNYGRAIEDSEKPYIFHNVKKGEQIPLELGGRQQDRFSENKESIQEKSQKEKVHSETLLRRENVLAFLASWLRGSCQTSGKENIDREFSSFCDSYNQPIHWKKKLDDLESDLIPIMLEYFDDSDVLCIASDFDNPRNKIINRILSEITTYGKELGVASNKPNVNELFTTMRNNLTALRSNDKIRRYIVNTYGAEETDMIAYYTLPSNTVAADDLRRKNILNYYDNLNNWD